MASAELLLVRSANLVVSVRLFRCPSMAQLSHLWTWVHVGIRLPFWRMQLKGIDEHCYLLLIYKGGQFSLWFMENEAEQKANGGDSCSEPACDVTQLGALLF